METTPKMSHYQAYLKAVGSSDQKRNSSAPVLPVNRKTNSYSTIPNTAFTLSQPKPQSTRNSMAGISQRSASPSLSSRAASPAPTSSPSAQFNAAAASAVRTGLSSHPLPAPAPSSPLIEAMSAPTSDAAPTAIVSSVPAHKQKTQKTHPSTPTAPQPSTSTPTIATTTPNPHLNPISESQISTALHHALSLLTVATTHHHKRPFSALLLAPDNHSILLTHFSISHIRHAESELARLASDHFPVKYLRGCTLVSTWEPCAMCAGCIYWSGIGRVVYAGSEEKLRQLVGMGNEENLTLDLPCRNVFEAGQSAVEVVGPIPEWEERVVDVCRPWWRQHGGAGNDDRKVSGNARNETNGVNDFQASEQQQHKKAESMVTTWTGEESVLSSIGEDGEYKADLDIDWMR